MIKNLPKPQRKLKQIEHAAHACSQAKLVKLVSEYLTLCELCTQRIRGEVDKFNQKKSRKFFEV